MEQYQYPFELEYLHTVNELSNINKDIDDNFNGTADEIRIELVKNIIQLNKCHLDVVLKLNYSKWKTHINTIYIKCLQFEAETKTDCFKSFPSELLDEFNKTNNELKEVLKLLMTE